MKSKIKNKPVIRKKFLILTYWLYIGFEKTDIQLVRKLRRNKNCLVTYAVFTEGLIKDDARKRNYFSKFPCISESFKDDKDFKEANAIWINSFGHLDKLIKDHDIIITGAFRGMDYFLAYIRYQDKILISHQNPANLEICFAKYLPNQLYLHNEIINNIYSQSIKKKKIKKIFKSDNFKITGSVQYCQTTKEEKKDKIFFYEKYGLDLNKELIMFLPPNPASMFPHVLESYKKITDILLEKPFNLMLKLHPTDRQKRKISSYDSRKESWEVINMKLKVVEDNDFYKILKYSKFVISLGTTAFQDINILNKPIIFVDRYKKFFIRESFHDQIDLNENFYQKEYGVQNFMLNKKQKMYLINNYGDKIFDHNYHTLNRLGYPNDLMNYYGLDADYDFIENITEFRGKISEKDLQDMRGILKYDLNSKSLDNISDSIFEYLSNYRANILQKLFMRLRLKIFLLRYLFITSISKIKKILIAS
ncbi:MAG: hypothetical protein CMF96_10855 [Candidatus Marinimicrobia bacterium]|nr:hypothetical protein [Candidatus Neomarinimicrobiota bacterium]OUV97228.1 MAG: hypothetical protein CBD02_03690 [Candidatus Pelagibacter sp. TMED142]